MDIEAPILETERLWLRPLRTSDLDDYAALYADPEVVRHLGGGGQPWDRGRAWRHLAFVCGHWLLAGTGSWAVEHKASGAFLGVIGFSEPEGWPGLELAWVLARRWWGFGYATEGARAALDRAFTRWKRDRVISLISPENRRSARVAERLGETLQGRLPDHFGREMLCYGIEREGYGVPELGRPHGAALAEALEHTKDIRTARTTRTRAPIRRFFLVLESPCRPCSPLCPCSGFAVAQAPRLTSLHRPPDPHPRLR